MLTAPAGHLRNPTPPESPAILHYKGASFDVVNPHASLLLVSSALYCLWIVPEADDTRAHTTLRLRQR